MKKSSKGIYFLIIELLSIFLILLIMGFIFRRVFFIRNIYVQGIIVACIIGLFDYTVKRLKAKFWKK